MAQNKMTIRKGDTVKVIAGKDKGAQGEKIDIMFKLSLIHI